MYVDDSITPPSPGLHPSEAQQGADICLESLLQAFDSPMVSQILKRCTKAFRTYVLTPAGLSGERNRRLMVCRARIV